MYEDSSRALRVCADLPEAPDPECGYTICTAIKFAPGMENEYFAITSGNSEFDWLFHVYTTGFSFRALLSYADLGRTRIDRSQLILT